MSVNLYGWIGFNMLLAIAPIVGNVSRREIDIVADNLCTPRRPEELRKRALPGLIGSQCPDTRLMPTGRRV